MNALCGSGLGRSLFFPVYKPDVSTVNKYRDGHAHGEDGFFALNERGALKRCGEEADDPEDIGDDAFALSFGCDPLNEKAHGEEGLSEESYCEPCPSDFRIGGIFFVLEPPFLNGEANDEYESDDGDGDHGEMQDSGDQGRERTSFPPDMDEVAPVYDDVYILAEDAQERVVENAEGEQHDRTDDAHVPEEVGHDAFFLVFGSDPLDEESTVEYGCSGHSESQDGCFRKIFAHQKEPPALCINAQYIGRMKYK